MALEARWTQQETNDPIDFGTTMKWVNGSLAKIHAATALCLAAGAALHPVTACPGCNIHNHLASSVCSSSNIVVGKLVARETDYSAKVEVVRKLFGRYRAGQVVSMPSWNRPEDVGQTFVLSDPTDRPSFEQLELDFEDEVVFLLKLRKLQASQKPGLPQGFIFAEPIYPETLKRYQVKDADEAIRLVQGFSNESKQVAMDYLRKLQPFPEQKIIQAADALRLETVNGNGSTTAANGMANLLEALMVSGSDEAQGYLLAQTSGFA